MRRIVVALLATSALSVSAFAADMPVKAPPMVTAAPFNWTGFYIGANAGYVWSSAKTTDVTGYNAAGSEINYRPNGFQGGGQIGYNYQIGQVVLGIEGEVGYLGLNKSQQYPPFVGVRTSADSVAHTSDGAYGVIAGRLGYAFNNVLVYAKGGGIFTTIKSSFTDTDPTGITLVSGTDTSRRNGWTVGFGGEYAVTRNWIARLEYAHYDFGTLRNTATGSNGLTYSFDHKLSADSVRVGISYLFH